MSESSSHRPDPPRALTIRPLENEREFENCLALQRETWGEDCHELVPPTMLMVSQKVGGIAAGAFDQNGRLVGFVYGLTGLREGRPTHWSHMLAVTETLRGCGVGQQLKHYQREQLRRLGVEQIYWSYDPLVARNAHLNLNRLGASVVEYVQDMYGDNPDSKTDSVIGSDRLIVRWGLDGEPRPSPGIPVGLPSGALVTLDPVIPDAIAGGELADEPRVSIEIPPDIQELKGTRPDLARAWRVLTRRAFVHYLGRGYVVRGLERETSHWRCFYVLERHDR